MGGVGGGGAGLSQVPIGCASSVDGVGTCWDSCLDAKRCLLCRIRFVISLGLYNEQDDGDDSAVGVEDRWDKTTTPSAGATGGGRTTVSICSKYI